ncbi:MAG: amino acid ABC transporter permease [Candidatus Korarchaeum sp.]
MEFLLDFLVALSSGLMRTLELLMISAPCGIALGVFVAVLSVYGGRILSTISRIFTATFTGFPLLVTMLLIFFGLPELGVYLGPTESAILSLVLCSGAYISQYVRGAILSIDEGQSLAARALGMTRAQEILYIVLPQALRRAIPSVSNEVVYMVQYSSLAFAIGVQEMYSISKSFNSINFRPLEIFSILALFYLVLCASVSLLFNSIRRRFSVIESLG